ncbi:MAG: Fe-S cluster assembly protein SufD [Spirulina sp. SIO3F2]|nr:Fe-S cluster assembly protein SufD [Spirulina sp. SIO3F2]
MHNLLRLSSLAEVPAHAEISGWLDELRQRFAYDVAHSQLPSQKDETWRFTDLSDLLTLNFVAAQSTLVQPEAIAPFQIPEAQGAELVFINGVYTPELSQTDALPKGVFVGNLATLPLDDNYDAIRFIAHHEGMPDVFTALNTAGFPDVAIIWVSPDVVVETPIHLLWVTVPGSQPTLIQPRGLVISDRNSQLSLIEQYVTCGTTDETTPYLTNAVMEMFVHDNATLTHTRLQQESAAAQHIATTMVRQAQDSTYTCNTLDLGAKLSRHAPSVWQKGSGTTTILNGLTLIKNEQVSDTHSLIALKHPHGQTDQLHKCVVDEAAQAVFSGKVLVPQAAQQTNAAQLNRNLLLSSKARVTTQPQLQITADNVQCTHGATVSQIDADELFYLQSRGINVDQAKVLLLRAFAAEVIERMAIESVRDRLTKAVANYTKA